MAINKNHEFEDLDGIKCSVVEKNASPERLQFLKALLELNHYTVVVTGSPAPKAAPAPVPVSTPLAEGGEASTSPMNPTPAEPEVPPAPTTFTIGVTDLTFNATNAVFGRLLKTADGHIVTLAYWQQKELTSDDTVPYFDHG